MELMRELSRQPTDLLKQKLLPGLALRRRVRCSPGMELEGGLRGKQPCSLGSITHTLPFPPNPGLFPLLPHTPKNKQPRLVQKNRLLFTTALGGEPFLEMVLMA